MFGRWAVIVGLSMTPALIAGQSAACTAGIAWHADVWLLLPVVAVSSFVEGVIVAWLAGGTTKLGFVARLIERFRTPKAMALAERWGAWGGLIFGVAFVGQEPILVALRLLGVEMRKIWAPLAVGNALFTVLYYEIVKLGLDQLLKIF